jgi:RimJ/RimL family protein N-acetyltransferase
MDGSLQNTIAGIPLVPTIQAAGLQLRPWQIEDLPVLVSLANNPKIAANLLDAFPHPYTARDGMVFIYAARAVCPVTLFAIEALTEPNKWVLVGSIGFFPQNDVHRYTAEIGYWIGEPYWGKRYASQAIGLLVTYLFRNYDFMRLEAKPFAHNIASIKALERNGFRLEAQLKQAIYKDGTFVDEAIYSLLRTSVITQSFA